MRRRKGTGSVCHLGNRWVAYGPERRIDGKRTRKCVGSACSKREALHLLDRWIAWHGETPA